MDDNDCSSAAQEKGGDDVQSMDTNNDGVVDAAEFAAAGGSKQEFDQYDLNADGVLDADEMAYVTAEEIQFLAERNKQRSQAKEPSEPCSQPWYAPFLSS